LDGAQRIREIFFRLPRKSDDDVGGEGQIGYRRAQFVDALEVALSRVPPQHALEGARRSRLHGQVHMLAYHFRLCQSADDAPAEIVRVRARESQSLQARYSTDRAQEIGEIVLAVEIRVHRLPEKYDLGNSRGNNCLR